MRLSFASASLCVCLFACAKGGEGPIGGAESGGSGDGGDVSANGGDGGGGSAPECGNGMINAGEACDGDNLDATACEDVGFVAGTLACDAACEFDTSGCIETLCDNGTLDADEDCDGTDLGVGTCVGEGFAGGTLACDVASCQFDTASCKPSLSEGFEGPALPVGFTTSGNANWYVDASSFNTGTKSYRSGDINDYGTSSLYVSLSYDAAGSISFFHRESTETCCDFLNFYIDGVFQTQWATDSWQQASYPVAAGSHTFEWRFTKDLSVSTGSDAVWIDDVLATGGYLP